MPPPEIPPPRAVPTGTLLIKDVMAIATLNKDLGDISNGAIYVKGNVIEWVGSSDSIPEQYQQADQVLSLPGRVIMPGMVNTHHHMFQSLTRCVAQVRPQPSYPMHGHSLDATSCSLVACTH